MPAEPKDNAAEIAKLRKEIDEASLDINKGHALITNAKVKIAANTHKIKELSK